MISLSRGCYLVYKSSTKQCLPLSTRGLTRGLAYSDKRHFAFRANDGTILDVNQMSTEPTSVEYIVNPQDGRIGGSSGTKVLFPYDKDRLRFALDFDISGNSEIVTVAGTGTSAHIGLMNPYWPSIPAETPPVYNICPMGAMGWSQTFNGIAATSWSEALLQPQDEAAQFIPDHTRMALFYVKSTLELFTVSVTHNPLSTLNFGFLCSVQKDASEQLPEWSRILAISSSLLSRPFFRDN